MSETTRTTRTVSSEGAAKGMMFSMRHRPDAATDPGAPLVVALPGGTYTSLCFDVPGQSLLDRAESVGVPVVAVDRPGYLASTKVEPAGSIITANAEVLDHLVAELWAELGAGRPGVVVVGHSIGAAITTAIAARHPSWPLLGIAVSGCLVRVPAESGDAWAALPDEEFVELPGPVKDFVMFGPGWTCSEAMPQAGHAADAPVPKAELLDITGGWVERMSQVAAAFTGAPWVDARLVPNAGHCIDFHLSAGAFQLQQLAFALECAVQTARPDGVPVSAPATTA